MKFGPIPVVDALGATLAHSVVAGEGRLRKGTVLTGEHLDALTRAQIDTVTVARLDQTDVAENTAAQHIANGLRAPGLRLAEAFTGRVNLHAEVPGVLSVDSAGVNALNAVDEAITLATLPHLARVEAGAMVATVKIIPYAVSDTALRAARPTGALLTLHPFQALSTRIILTRTPGLKDSVVAKGGVITAKRLAGFGLTAPPPVIVSHEVDAIAGALADATEDLILILGGSATSDRNDTVPAGVRAAGGQIERFGMPVDPGNLLFLARRGASRIIGLPGCARSPALNGADWVLERIVAGLEVTGEDIAAMGVGGLLKEIPTRPQPRQRRKEAPTRTAILLLAAGAGQRMRGADKVLEPVDGIPLLRRLAQRALASGASTVAVAVPKGHDARIAALTDLPVEIVEVADAVEGMSASLRAAAAHVAGKAEAAIVMLADMPDITTDLLDRLIARVGTQNGAEIVRPVLSDGRAGHPVLFGRIHFDALRHVTGDQGARQVIASNSDHLDLIEVEGNAPLTDLDTPEAWADWRRQNDLA